MQVPLLPSSEPLRQEAWAEGIWPCHLRNNPLEKSRCQCSELRAFCTVSVTPLWGAGTHLSYYYRCSLLYRRSMFHGQAGETVYERGTQTHPRHLIPHPSSTFPPPLGPHKDQAQQGQSELLWRCSSAAQPSGLLIPSPEPVTGYEWAGHFLTVLLLGHGLIFYFKADFKVITINWDMCQVLTVLPA